MILLFLKGTTASVLVFQWCGYTLHSFIDRKNQLLSDHLSLFLSWCSYRSRFSMVRSSRPKMVPLHPLTFQKNHAFFLLQSSTLFSSPNQPTSSPNMLSFPAQPNFPKTSLPIPFPCTFRIFFFRPSPYSVHVHAKSFLFLFHLPKPLW